MSGDEWTSTIDKNGYFDKSKKEQQTKIIIEVDRNVCDTDAYQRYKTTFFDLQTTTVGKYQVPGGPPTNTPRTASDRGMFDKRGIFFLGGIYS